MRQADEVVTAIKEETQSAIQLGGDEQTIKRSIEKQVSRRMTDIIGRTPLVLPVFMQD
jgi:mRNA degradation ribonuclease J1/J2